MPFRSAVGQVIPLGQARYGDIAHLLVDPAASCLAEARMFPYGAEPDRGNLPTVLAHVGADGISSALMLGANLVPIGTDHEGRAAFAAELIRMGRRCSSIVGPAPEVLDLWALLEPGWGAAREVRPDQPLMAMAAPPANPADPQVAAVAPHQLESYLPASIAMFTEEVGVDPRLGGMEQLYRERVADLLRTRRAFARWEGNQVAFKAEFGAVTSRAVQVQGVWVAPGLRGRGLAEPGMAAVVQEGLKLAPLVTLYVNSYNAAALATYRAVGFEQVGTFATVLF